MGQLIIVIKQSTCAMNVVTLQMSCTVRVSFRETFKFVVPPGPVMYKTVPWMPPTYFKFCFVPLVNVSKLMKHCDGMQLIDTLKLNVWIRPGHNNFSNDKHEWKNTDKNNHFILLLVFSFNKSKLSKLHATLYVCDIILWIDLDSLDM